MLVAGARDEEHLRLSRELNLRSALVVPLSARGRTLGAITLVRAEQSRPFTEAELTVAEDLGRRAGLAIDNSLLYSQTQNVALQLQRAVLPDDLSDIPGWQIAAHYSPGGHADVGGDFYDAVRLADGSLAVFIGDVMGHGVAAAAAMAHMRAAVRAYLSIDPDPGVLVGRLDTMFATLQVGQLVSLVYGVVNPAGSRLRLVSAGHYPPLLVAPDGSSRFAETVPQRLLGVGPVERRVSEWQLEAGSVVLLYTDGLIERREEGIDLGLARLRNRGSELASGSLAVNLERLATELRDESGSDDVTAIAVRAQG
jgi:serine phosphatase RsbU (regulator of sigma subunit)